MTIYNLGSINVDHVYRLHHMPQPGETMASRDYAQGLGGKGANQSVAAARAGAQVVHIGAISAQGEDWVLDRLAEYGVDITHIARLPHVASGHAIILLDAGGENAIILHPGANGRLEAGSVERALEGIGPDDTLLLQNETNLQVEAARIARAAGARVIYSCAPFDIDAAREVLPHVTLLALNEVEAAQLTAASPAGIQVPAMLVTLGADGAEYRDLAAGTVARQPAFPVEVVDTTGAGDCFAGYLAAGLDMGRDLPEAMRHAAAAAAIKVTRAGAGDAIPEAAEVLDFLATHRRD
ncbi:ribokinase [Paracoccus xiamenensis]|uniref:ribokinase n=1 Tax=Paracoccus xiamenensis TaxID=2714901 RepID=UPI001407ADC7|nr:ribokinase [Paracoccus xiamenensis]NHF73752.1 ribokinase [Paracoccus xiamenensis]